MLATTKLFLFMLFIVRSIKFEFFSIKNFNLSRMIRQGNFSFRFIHLIMRRSYLIAWCWFYLFRSVRIMNTTWSLATLMSLPLLHQLFFHFNEFSFIDFSNFRFKKSHNWSVVRYAKISPTIINLVQVPATIK